MKIPENVLTIAKTLNNAGFDAYVVGGAVRDMVLDKEPHDYDIATNARPEQVKALFKRTVDTGIAHGTVTAMFGKEGYEITTYRCDGKYSDGRHPDEVVFMDRIEDDLGRRDFTFNAMAYDPIKKKLVDPYNGEADLKTGIIRTVGDPKSRFKEDALRMMRAARFHAKFGFPIEDNTYNAMCELHEDIRNLSVERIRSEIDKILEAKYSDKGIEDLKNTGMLKLISVDIDEMFSCEQNNPWHFEDVGHHSLRVLMSAKEDGVTNKAVLWAALLHDVGKPLAKKTGLDGTDHFPDHSIISSVLTNRLLQELKFSNEERVLITALVRHHDTCFTDIVKVRKFVSEYTENFLTCLYSLQTADAKSHAKDYAQTAIGQKDDFRGLVLQVLKDHSAVKISDLKVNGNDLVEMGFEGTEIGRELKKLQEICFKNPELNKHDELLGLASKHLDEWKKIRDIYFGKFGSSENDAMQSDPEEEKDEI